ncbi:MAG: YeeE/YedE family protein [Hyphomicrobiales bacterium]|nr:MAG: YeeE/YedE family protein [Hyphomicrobiales bacterium]
MGAIEDLLIGHDARGAKAWALAAAVAIAGTQIAAASGLSDPSSALYLSSRLHVLGTLLGGILFGLGMTLVGTCSFGLIVRSGGGDLRALVTAGVVGICAYVATSGLLAPLRIAIWDAGVVQLPVSRPASLPAIATWSGGPVAAGLLILAVAGGLGLLALADPRLRKRPRLLGSACAMGAAVALGWIVTGQAVEAMTMERAESLSFVAPMGRALLQVMIEPFRNVGFGVSALAGVCVGSFAVTALRRELRLEAFDDPREMRRHLVGAGLMGVGGVLAQGCTIGQGLSATSVLAPSALLFLPALLLGARIGLWHLIEGQTFWRPSKSG